MQRLPKTPRPLETPPTRVSASSGHGWLFLATFPMVTWAFEGSAQETGTAFLVFGLLLIAVRVLTKGDEAAKSYAMTPGARAPFLPRRIIGSALLGSVVFLLAGHHFATLFMPLVFGALALGLGLVAFGLDPMRNKPIAAAAPDHRAEAQSSIERADYALAQIADKVAMLEDLELTRRTEAARTSVLRIMRGFARDPAAVLRVEKPVRKFTRLLDTEAERLCRSGASESAQFARKRFLAKLDVMIETFEKSARGMRKRGDKDLFEMEADLLLDRMPQTSAS